MIHSPLERANDCPPAGLSDNSSWVPSIAMFFFFFIARLEARNTTTSQITTMFWK